MVIGAPGRVTKEFDKWIEKVGIPCNAIDMQKTVMNSKDIKRKSRWERKKTAYVTSPA